MKVNGEWIDIMGTALVHKDRWKNEFCYLGGVDHMYLLIPKFQREFVNWGYDGNCFFFDVVKTPHPWHNPRYTIQAKIVGVGYKDPRYREEEQIKDLPGVYDYFGWIREDYEEFQIW